MNNFIKSNFIKSNFIVKKFFKGIFFSFVIIVSTALIIQSCKKSDEIIKDNAAQNFLSALNKQSQIIRSIPVIVSENRLQSSSIKNQSIQSNSENKIVKNSEPNYRDNQTAFINFDNMPINPNYSYNINGMANLIANYNGTFSYVSSEIGIQFSLHTETANNYLAPLISEAKLYLNARGFSDSEINEMVIEEGGQEADLVALVTSLAEYEQTGDNLTKVNYLNLFINSANAEGRSVFDCAMVAIGVDAVMMLGTSNAKQWTKAGIKKAFGAVAKRFLGPIGVTIAIVTFGLCLGDYLP